MRQVSIEVYAFDGNRWTLQQAFQGRQRESALEFAHSLYAQAHIKGVRVMEETHDDISGEVSEKSLLKRTKSDEVPKSLSKEIKAKQAAPPKPKPEAKAYPVASKPVPGAPGVGAAKGAAAARAAFAQVEAEPARRMSPAAKRVTGGIAGSLAGGAVLAAGGGLLVSQMPADAQLVTALKSVFGQNYLLAGTVVLLGLGVIASAFLLYVAATDKSLLESTAPVKAAGPVSVKFPVIEMDDDDVMVDVRPTPLAAATAAAAAKSPAPGEPPKPPTVTEAPPAPDLTVDAAYLMGFFHDCLATVSRGLQGKTLDAFNWFGCHLFLAGLVEAEGRRRGWDVALRRKLIAASMTAVQKDPTAAARFAARYEDYLTEPRNLAMFKAGVEAAAAQANLAPNASLALQSALEAWNAKPEQTLDTGHVVVMFTDIIGSTEFTQTHGDAKQYEMVQAHNRIVRDALGVFSGREIKHTGDGIMAAFDDAALAVHASLQIQRDIKAHREVSPDIGMALRIGLAAGEPIKEGRDLFGSTVQLAARVCALAEANQIVVADMVREIAAPTGLEFASLGEQTLKGFKQKVPVYRVTPPA